MAVYTDNVDTVQLQSKVGEIRRTGINLFENSFQ